MSHGQLFQCTNIGTYVNTIPTELFTVNDNGSILYTYIYTYIYIYVYMYIYTVYIDIHIYILLRIDIKSNVFSRGI